jgi:hypothetical protein
MADESLAACLAEIKANPGRLYVYVLSRPCGTPFYVGCGRKKRIARHEDEAKTPARSRKISIIRKIKKAGDVVRYRIDSWWGTWPEVARREIELINLLGRLDLKTGSLSNVTAGGDGATEPSPLTRQKKADATRARWADSEYREKMSDQSRRFWSDPENRKTVSEAVKRTRSLNGRDAEHSERIKAKWRDDPEYRARHEASMKPTRERQAASGHHAAAARKFWSDAEKVEIYRANMRAKFAEDADFRARHAEGTRAALSTPEMRKRQSDRSKEMWSRPGFKEKIAAQRREAFEAKKAAAQ